jgi:hypothetical protein
MHNHPRIIGILAAREYILSRTPAPETVQEIKSMGTVQARSSCLYGIKLPPYERKLKNALGNALPSISL